jgi:pimeloyl-ACP methyl ester carboxylesterase
MGFHGFGGEHKKSFSRLFDYMPDDVSFYGVDLPGLGSSNEPKHWTYDHVSELLAREVDRVSGGEPVTFVGSCSGTYHALEMALRRPDVPDRIAMVEPFAYFPWFFNLFMKPLFGRPLYDLVFSSKLGQKATQMGLQRQGIANDYDVMGSYSKQSAANGYRYLQFYRECEIRGTDVFRSIDTPMLLVHGYNTFNDVLKSIDIWSSLFDDVEIVALSDVGHQVTQEAPERLAAVLFGNADQRQQAARGAIDFASAAG